jgi:hypothetical protein
MCVETIGTLRILKEMRTVMFKLVDRIVGRVIVEMIGILRILKEVRTVTFKLVDRIVGRIIIILGVKLIEMTWRELVEGM